MPIDTLKASKQLKDLGFNEGQAEGLAELLSDLDVASATKEDLNEVEERLNQRIELSEERLGQKVEDIRSSIVSAVAAVGAVLAVVIPLSIYLFG